MVILFSNCPYRAFCIAKTPVRELYIEVWVACLRALNPGCSDQHCSNAQWKKLVLLVRWFPFPCLCSLWFLDRLHKANSMAESFKFVDCDSLCVFIPIDSNVLLVAACTAKSTTMVCVYNPVCHCDDFEHHIPLIVVTHYRLTIRWSGPGMLRDLITRLYDMSKGKR